MKPASASAGATLPGSIGGSLAGANDTASEPGGLLHNGAKGGVIVRELIKDGNLDIEAVNAYTDELLAEMLKHDRVWLAQRLAIATASKEIDRQTRARFDKHSDAILKTAFGLLDSQRDAWIIGLSHRRAQSARRKGKPAADPYDQDRNARIRAHHARLTAAGDDDSTAQTAGEFGLSPRQVRNILKA